MATIRKLTRSPSSNRSLWQAQVRKKGIPPLSKCFKTKSEAVLWAQTAESEIDRNLYVDCSEAETGDYVSIIDMEIINTLQTPAQD
jgi:hypothetical protein